MLALTSIGQVRLTRGDTLVLPIEINQGDNLNPFRYDLQPLDEVYFALMEPNQPWEQAILKKKYTYIDQVNGVITLKLRHSDTMCLYPGLYYYQIKVRIYDEEAKDYIVNTIIPKTHFWVEE